MQVRRSVGNPQHCGRPGIGIFQRPPRPPDQCVVPILQTRNDAQPIQSFSFFNIFLMQKFVSFSFFSLSCSLFPKRPLPPADLSAAVILQTRNDAHPTKCYQKILLGKDLYFFFALILSLSFPTRFNPVKLFIQPQMH